MSVKDVTGIAISLMEDTSPSKGIKLIPDMLMSVYALFSLLGSRSGTPGYILIGGFLQDLGIDTMPARQGLTQFLAASLRHPATGFCVTGIFFFSCIRAFLNLGMKFYHSFNVSLDDPVARRIFITPGDSEIASVFLMTVISDFYRSGESTCLIPICVVSALLIAGISLYKQIPGARELIKGFYENLTDQEPSRCKGEVCLIGRNAFYLLFALLLVFLYPFMVVSSWITGEFALDDEEIMGERYERYEKMTRRGQEAKDPLQFDMKAPRNDGVSLREAMLREQYREQKDRRERQDDHYAAPPASSR